MFSSKIFKVLSFTCRSTIYFELILVCGVSHWLKFIFLYMHTQLFQPHLLKTQSFCHWLAFASCSEIGCSYRYESVSKLPFPLSSCYTKNSLTVRFEVREYKSSNLVFFQSPLTVVVPLLLHMNLELAYQFLYVKEKPVGTLTGTATLTIWVWFSMYWNLLWFLPSAFCRMQILYLFCQVYT